MHVSSVITPCKCMALIFAILHFSFPAALGLISSGEINTEALLSHRYALSEVVSAFEMAKSGKAVKVIVDCTATI